MNKALFVAMSLLLAGCMVKHASAPVPLSDSQLATLWKAPEKSAEMLVSEMGIREKIGQLMMPDIRHWQGDNDQGQLDVTVLHAALTKAIHDYRLGGIILFREHMITTPHTYQLIGDIQKERYRLPLLIGTDQEGGYVTHLREGTQMPGNMALAATRDVAMARVTGKVHGAKLSALGIHINFAPSVDVNINQNNSVIGVRSFSSDTSLINRMADGYIQGLQSYSVTATVTYFPGHGSVAMDSHIGLPVTLSEKIVTGILRDELQYKGLIFRDALDMGAIADNFGTDEAVERALLAGVNTVQGKHIFPLPSGRLSVDIRDQTGIILYPLGHSLFY